MSQHRPVPRLDLAPKLKRPLSVWNPLDYLRLLYWVFFFPQALRWYVDTFGGGYIPLGKINGRKEGELERQHRTQLLLQGLVLTVAIALAWVALGVIFQKIVVLLNWFDMRVSPNWFSVALVVASIGEFGMTLVVMLVVASVVGFDLVQLMTLVVMLVVASVVGFDLVQGMTMGVVAGTVLYVTLGVAWGVVWGVVLRGAVGVSSGLLLSGVVGVASVLVLGMVWGVAWSVAWIVVLGMAKLRPVNWLLGISVALCSPRSEYWQIPHVTSLPIPFLSSRLTHWLRQDWESGVHNVNQLLSYTLQFSPVVQAINHVFAETPLEQAIIRVVKLVEDPFNWELVHSVSDFVVEEDDEKTQLHKPTPASTPSGIAAAGFWHLYEKEPEKAKKHFAEVRSLFYGEEMFTLAQTLVTLNEAKEQNTIAARQVLTFRKEPLLRPATWEAIASLRRVVEDVQLVQGSVSRSAKAFALARAQGELTKILNNADALPQAERGLILDIAQTWQKALLQVTGEVGEISITKPVTNPYVVGDPVEGNLFVGREDVLRQLEELWVIGHQLQSVVLYGHRRMGKTSILLNAANSSGSGVKVAYINLLTVADSPQGVGEVLMAISDAISDAVGCTPPPDADLLNLPYRTFERYLKQVEAHLSGGLIVALDEFEKIDELIEAKKIPKDFMGYLRGLVQMSSKVAFAFAGLHTLEEMTADYFQPFFASVIPIHVGFLQPAATRQILANPTDDDSSLSSPRGGGIEGGEFPLDYTPEALDQIYTLTAGQPYLVQLVGFQLVRRYNDYVFEQGRPRDPVFTVKDVEAVINDPEFFKRGRYYFDGVWGQAARGASGQQAILRALAPHPEGFSINTLKTRLDDFVGATHVSPLQEEKLQNALKTLTRHDVIQEREGRWQIIVELFRRWVLQN